MLGVEGARHLQRDDAGLGGGRGGEGARFDGLEYRFDSSRDRHIFLSARETYVPMLRGDCPVTYAETGNRVAGKLEYGLLHRRRLIFFAGPDEQRRFAEAPDKYENVDLVLDGRVQIAPFVEMHALDEINPVFEAVHRREIRRRVVLTP